MFFSKKKIKEIECLLEKYKSDYESLLSNLENEKQSTLCKYCENSYLALSGFNSIYGSNLKEIYLCKNVIKCPDFSPKNKE